MYRYLLSAIILIMAIHPLAAEDKETYYDFEKDRFMAGATVVQDAEGVDDLFMAGETVRSKEDITGSAHLVGRKIISTGVIGKNAYLAGMDVSLDGKVAGDATVSGYNVNVGEVAGDLRISGANLTISGPVSGYVLAAGDEVRFESAIQGDVSLTARDVEFANGARIAGKLTIYEEQKGALNVPAEVIAEDRIERREIAEWSDAAQKSGMWSWRRALTSFFTGVLLIAGIAALIAAFVPTKLAELRRNILDQPSRSLIVGFLTLSAVIGSTIVLMMTGIGLLIAPATLILALLGAFAGYVVGAYAVGVGLLLLIKRPEPDSFVTRALAAGIGAFVVAVIALIPLLGWLFVMMVALAGAGSIGIWLFRPKFFAHV